MVLSIRDALFLNRSKNSYNPLQIFIFMIPSTLNNVLILLKKLPNLAFNFWCSRFPLKMKINILRYYWINQNTNSTYPIGDLINSHIFDVYFNTEVFRKTWKFINVVFIVLLLLISVVNQTNKFFHICLVLCWNFIFFLTFDIRLVLIFPVKLQNNSDAAKEISIQVVNDYKVFKVMEFHVLLNLMENIYNNLDKFESHIWK